LNASLRCGGSEHTLEINRQVEDDGEEASAEDECKSVSENEVFLFEETWREGTASGKMILGGDFCSYVDR